MRGLITQDNYQREPTRYLYINGIRHSNSAAKFWPALIEEAEHVNPATDRIMIRGISAGELDTRQLFPEVWLRKDLETLLHHNLEEVMRQTAAELELTGPPSSVNVTLLSKNDQEITRAELPLDCIDADLLSFFLVWILRWSGIDESKWNNEFIEGSFHAEDRFNKREYDFSFTLHNNHLSEGLYDRTCTLPIRISHTLSSRNVSGPDHK